MTLPQANRDAAITTLQRIRSKALDTEKRILLDDLDAEHVLVRASEIEGQAQLLAMTVLQENEPANKR